MSRFLKNQYTPFLLLLAINLVAGILTFKDFGVSWDEPLFYNYADSIRIAYTPQAFSPGFDFYQVFGRSPEDHKIYGPAYLLLARPIQQSVMVISGTDSATAWHLINFFSFQLGLLAFFLLVCRWFDPWPAVISTAFLAWQPVFWGHAFINPKDIPFMVLVLLALLSGLDFVDHLITSDEKIWWRLLLAALILGLASATRVIGPLVGFLVFLYFLLNLNWHRLPYLIIYGLIAVIIMFLFWPYLWADPLSRLIEVFRHMSNNPTELAVLFDGQLFRANEMPRRYLPQMLLITLTDPTWLLFIFGLFIAIRGFITKKVNWRAPSIVIILFVFMLAYVVYNRPSVYDGFRHFFFITPPIFVVIGFFFQWLWEKTNRYLWSIVALLTLLPGLVGIINLHPYEYTYYNSFVGGVGGAFRRFETDYWLTCYKEALNWSKNNAPDTIIHIQREYPLAAYYNTGLNLKDQGAETDANILSGDLLLFNTRGDLDIRSVYRKLPEVHTFGRDGAEFCIIKKKD